MGEEGEMRLEKSRKGKMNHDPGNYRIFSRIPSRK